MEELIAELDPEIVVLVTAFLPLVQAVINRAAWVSEAKAIAAFVVAILVGIGTSLLMGVDSREGIITVTAATYALSQVSYRSLWRPTGVADQIEQKTG